MGPRFDVAWSLQWAAIVKIVTDAQRELEREAAQYVPAVLAATGQAVPEAAGAVAGDTLVGVTGHGVPLGAALAATPVRAKQAVSGGASPSDAMSESARWLMAATTTILADSWRTAESLHMATRNVGYVRAVNGGACGRCVILAGRWYRWNRGFDRHPGCKCYHIPASENVAGDWTTDPRAYFDSRTPAEQIKLMGSRANAQAVIDGADMGQIVNAYRRTNGLQVAGLSPIQTARYGSRAVRFTTEGTTRRGSAYAAMREHGAVKAANDAMAAGQRYHHTQVARIMPQSIYQHASSRSEALRLLRLYGWIT